MCRRLLVEVQEAARENEGHVPGEEQHRILAENFEVAMSRLQQFRAASDTAISDEVDRLFTGISPMLRMTSGNEAQDDDRREYSGMYS